MRDDIIERLESTREIIAAELARISKIDMTIAPPHARASVRTAALHIERALHAAGYRLVAPGELDAETVEQCAKLIESGYDKPVGKPWRKDGKPSKNDQCPHGRYMYEDCEPCAVIALRSLAGSKDKEGRTFRARAES